MNFGKLCAILYFMKELRNKRIERILQEELSKIMQKESNISPEILATLTKFEISSDAKTAKAWISILPEKERQKTMAELRKQLPYFQYLLVKKMNMKWVPAVFFTDDFTEEEASKIEDLIRSKTEE